MASKGKLVLFTRKINEPFLTRHAALFSWDDEKHHYVLPKKFVRILYALFAYINDDTSYRLKHFDPHLSAALVKAHVIMRNRGVKFEYSEGNEMTSSDDWPDISQPGLLFQNLTSDRDFNLHLFVEGDNIGSQYTSLAISNDISSYMPVRGFFDVAYAHTTDTFQI